jgi:hypothetical protein
MLEGKTMLRIDRNAKSLLRLEQKRLSEVELKERTDLQKMFSQSPDAFFEEMGEPLLLLGEEIRPATFVEDRIDLLALDKHGATVIIELKRGNHKLQLLQSLTYASMISKWNGTDLLKLRVSSTGRSPEDVEEDLTQLLELETEVENLNQVQRIVLIAEAFDYEILATAEWLTEKYELDIRCYRIALSSDGPNEFLTCTCVYPAPELAEHAIKRRRVVGAITPGKWSDWEAALKDLTEDVAAFYREELKAARSSYLPKRLLRFSLKGRRRWWVSARHSRCYVWQTGRFPNDEAFWKKAFGEDVNAAGVKNGQNLRFFLSSGEELRRFKKIVESEFEHIEFADAGGVTDTEGEAEA